MKNAVMNHGNPTEIIGEGKVAALLRRKYEQYNRGEWKSDVFGTTSELTGVAREKIEQDYKSATEKVKRKLKL
jgi:hypothetical protein